MKSVTGYGTRNNNSSRLRIGINYANCFFARFNEYDVSLHENILSSLMLNSLDDCSPAITIDIEVICSQLRHIKANKSAGPDGVHPRTLKTCADQLCPVLHSLFTSSLSAAKIPVVWKTSCLVSIPKKANVGNSLDNLRPIALTSHIMKCFERVGLVT